MKDRARRAAVHAHAERQERGPAQHAMRALPAVFGADPGRLARHGPPHRHVAAVFASHPRDNRGRASAVSLGVAHSVTQQTALGAAGLVAAAAAASRLL